MARVFLSYDRDDSSRARPIAAALQGAGHDVWWDRDIRGGEQFSKAIDEALRRADAIVVLWSVEAIESAWVRDEAAVGRDNGRLMPVLLDPILPPLGFRQFHCIDMSGWKGRGKPKNLEELLTALEGPKKPQAITDSLAPQQERARRQQFSSAKIAAGVAALIVLAAAAIFVRSRSHTNLETVTIAAADPASKPLAHNLMVRLAGLQAARSGSMTLAQAGEGDPKADLIFEVSGQAGSTGSPPSLTLLAGADRSVLWSQDFRFSDTTDLQQRLSFAAARVLGCALDASSERRAEVGQAVLKSYLNGCALLDETFFDDTTKAASILEDVTKRAPRFRPAWAKLLIAATNRYQGLSDEDKKANALDLQKLITAARKLDPEMPEAYVAEIELLPGGTFDRQVELIDRAVKAEPDNVYVLAARSLVMLCVGRMETAVEDARHAASLEPLSPAIRSAYLQALIYSGQTDVARSELVRAGRLWPDAATIADARNRLELRYGNLAEAADAAKMIQSGKLDSDRMTEAFVRARLNPTKPNVDRAVSLAKSEYQAHPGTDQMGELIITLGEFDRTDELVGYLMAVKDKSQIPYFVETMFRPPLADLRGDPRFMNVAARLGLLNYWQRSGNWPDFCSDPDLPYNCKKEAAKLQA